MPNENQEKTKKEELESTLEKKPEESKKTLSCEQVYSLLLHTRSELDSLRKATSVLSTQLTSLQGKVHNESLKNFLTDEQLAKLLKLARN